MNNDERALISIETLKSQHRLEPGGDALSSFLFIIFGGLFFIISITMVVLNGMGKLDNALAAGIYILICIFFIALVVMYVAKMIYYKNFQKVDGHSNKYLIIKGKISDTKKTNWFISNKFREVVIDGLNAKFKIYVENRDIHFLENGKELYFIFNNPPVFSTFFSAIFCSPYYVFDTSEYMLHSSLEESVISLEEFSKLR